MSKNRVPVRWAWFIDFIDQLFNFSDLERLSMKGSSMCGFARPRVTKQRRTTMNDQTVRLALATTMLWIGFGVRGRAEAGGIALSTPAGLSFGESFRFVFITDATTVAISPSIGHYNSFVNAQAGGATYDGSLVNWAAIGSTRSASAINNVGQSQTPVYLADGTLVTTSTTSTGLWSGSLVNPINEDLSGMGVRTGSTGVWTGTNTNGSTSADPLGDFFGVTIGVSTVTNAAW